MLPSGPFPSAEPKSTDTCSKRDGSSSSSVNARPIHTNFLLVPCGTVPFDSSVNSVKDRS